MENKLKGILEILEEENNKKNKGKKAEKQEKGKIDEKSEKSEKLEKVFAEMFKNFSHEKKDSSSFEYIKAKYLVEDCENKSHLSSYEDFDEDSYFKYIRKNDNYGKETIELYEYIREYSNNCIEYIKDDVNKNMDLEYVQKLIDKGADVNFVNNYENNYTCLMNAVESENIDLIKILLENGANPNVEQKDFSHEFDFSIMQDVFRLAITKTDEENDEENDYVQLFTAMVEVCDADIYMKNSSGQYAIVDFVNEDLENYLKNIAINLLEPYGFTEEDFDQNRSSNRKKTSITKNNNNKPDDDKELDQDFDEEFNIPENL